MVRYQKVLRGFLAVILIAVCSTLALTMQSAPRVVLSGTRHEFGEAFVNEALTALFTVKNPGNAPLELAERAIQPLKTAAVFSPRTSVRSLLAAASSRLPAPS